MEDLLVAGKIINTHSLKGEVRIYPYCDSAKFLCQLKHIFINNNRIDIRAAREHKGQALVKLDGIDDIESAKLLIGSLVYIDKNEIELEAGRYFIDDIIGLTVIDFNTSQNYGNVINVIATGANDVFEVKPPEGKTLLIPKIDDVVKEIDIENGIIRITPIKGLLDI